MNANNHLKACETGNFGKLQKGEGAISVKHVVFEMPGPHLYVFSLESKTTRAQPRNVPIFNSLKSSGSVI